MAIHVHFEYPEKEAHYIYDGVIEPTPKDICEYLGIENPSQDALNTISEMLSYDLVDMTNSNFIEFIEEKYYDIKRYWNDTLHGNVPCVS